MHTPITPTRFETRSELHRRLRSHHLIMIALGGAVGMGLFVASDASVAQAGPGGALLTYTLVGVMVYCLMTNPDELVVYLPISDSFVTYSRLYVGEGFGFTLRWSYWFALIVFVIVELAATQLVTEYWFPGVPDMIQNVAFLLLMFDLNAFSVRGSGEVEYWFSMIKVVTIVAFLLIGLAMIFGIIHGGPQSGWRDFTMGGAPFVGRVPAMVGVAIIAGFSFQGVETVGVAAGETENPSRMIPHAVRQMFWCILLFYVLAVLIIGMLLPYTDPNPLCNETTNVGVSPFALVFQHAGLTFAAGMMNTVVLTALLSFGTSSLYVSARVLYDLALEGQAPRQFAKVSANNVPYRALLATSTVSTLCFFSSLFGDQMVYLWLLNTSTVTYFITQFDITLAHYRFRKGFASQGHSAEQLTYRSPFFPFGPTMVTILCVVIILGQNTRALFTPVDNFGAFIATYCGVILFMAIWLAYRWKFKTRFVEYTEMQLGPTHLQQPEPTNTTTIGAVTN